MTLFFPSLKLWQELNTASHVASDRQFKNRAELTLDKAIQPELYGFIAHLPCCKTNPYTNKYQDVWLSFSDYYDDKLLECIIYYENETDLKDKILSHYGDKEQLDRQNKTQIKEWNEI